MKLLVKIICVYCFAAVFADLKAQYNLNRLDFDSIPQLEVKNLIRAQMSAGDSGFSDLEVSVKPNEDLSDFSHFQKTFKINEPVDEVWDIYRFAEQTELWDIKRVSFGMLFSRASHKVVYAGQYFYGMEKGQIYFLNLKILGGLYKLPVAFEVVTVDDKNRILEFSYLKGGKADGLQVIQFIESAERQTQVIHSSYVKSDSKFRDRYLYPFFHNKIIREFHANMKRIIMHNVKYTTRQIASTK